jgi:hypothetical protein
MSLLGLLSGGHCSEHLVICSIPVYRHSDTQHFLVPNLLLIIEADENEWEVKY